MKTAFMTKITRDAFNGKAFTGEREAVDHRSLRPKGKRANNTKPPRTRSGKNFPGGKALRKAHEILSARQRSFDAADGRVKNSRTRPGSMRG